MAKPKAPLIPPTKNAPSQKGPAQESVEMILIQINEHQRAIDKAQSAIGDLSTRLFNEVLARQNYINSLPAPEKK